jgi:hypothetical protein
MPDPDAKQLIDALVKFRDSATEKQHGAKVPLRVFALPCTLVV